MATKLDFLLDASKIDSFLNENKQLVFGDSENIKVITAERSVTYNPDSFNILANIDDNGRAREIRLSGNLQLSKKEEYRILQFFYENGFDKGDTLVAKPLAYFEDLNLMIYENLPGNVLMTELEDSATLGTKIKLSALALKKIHQLPKPDFSLWDSNNLFKFAQYEKNALAKYYPDLAERLDQIVEKIRDEILKIKSADFCHGDYQPSNVIIYEDKCFVMDFGISCLFDREYDVATFVNQLSIMLRRYGDFSQFEKLKNIFLETYGLYNINKYEIFSLLVNLRILVVFCVTQGKENNLDMMPVVESALRILIAKIGI